MSDRFDRLRSLCNAIGFVPDAFTLVDVDGSVDGLVFTVDEYPKRIRVRIHCDNSDKEGDYYAEAQSDVETVACRHDHPCEATRFCLNIVARRHDGRVEDDKRAIDALSSVAWHNDPVEE